MFGRVKSRGSMISYTPLHETLKNRGMTLDKLASLIEYPGLRRKLNSGTYLSLKTIDAMCFILQCGIKDLIEYKTGDMKKVNYVVGYEVDWAKVFDLLQSYRDEKGFTRPLTFRKASVLMGHSPSYLNNISLSRRTSKEVVQQLNNLLKVDIASFAKEITK